VFDDKYFIILVSASLALLKAVNENLPVFPMFDLSKIQYIRSSRNTTEQLVFCVEMRYSNLLEGITEIFPIILHFCLVWKTPV